MPNLIKYNTGVDTQSLKNKNFSIGVGDVDKGPSSSTGFYNGITPPTSGYTIYLYRPSGIPSIYVAANDSDLISKTNMIAGTSYTTTAECFTYFSTQTDKIILNRDYENISTNGLVLHFDAGFLPSYPRSNTVWYDLSGNGNHGLLTNGPTFTTTNDGAIVFDGTNDSIEVSGFTWTPTAFTISFFVSGTTRTSFNQALGAYNGWTNGFVFHTQSDGSIYCGTETTYRFAPPGIPANTYVTGSYQQFTFGLGGGTGYLYKNGTLVSSKSMPTSPGPWGGFAIGAPNSSTLHGAMSNIQIYNRLLSASEILSNYDTLKNRYVTSSIVTTNLTHRFDAGDASSYSGTGNVWTNLNGSNNLQLVNSPTFVSNGTASRFVFDGVNDFMTGSGYLTGSAAKSHTLNVVMSFAPAPGLFSRYRFFADNSNPTGYGTLQYFSGDGPGEIEISQGTTNFNASVYSSYPNEFSPLYTTAMYTFVSSNTGIDFYLNGTLLGGTTADTFVNSSFISPTRTYYWASAGLGSSPISMSIAHIMWYSSSLSAADITQNYNALKTRYGI